MCLAALHALLLLNLDTAAVPERNSVSVVLLSLPHIVFYGNVVYRIGKVLNQTSRTMYFKAALEVRMALKTAKGAK